MGSTQYLPSLVPLTRISEEESLIFEEFDQPPDSTSTPVPLMCSLQEMKEKDIFESTSQESQISYLSQYKRVSLSKQRDQNTSSSSFNNLQYHSIPKQEQDAFPQQTTDPFYKPIHFLPEIQEERNMSASCKGEKGKVLKKEDLAYPSYQILVKSDFQNLTPPPLPESYPPSIHFPIKQQSVPTTVDDTTTTTTYQSSGSGETCI